MDGTADSGLFMVSANGQETKYHFDKQFTHLVMLLSIDINSTTGKFFITDSKG
jgi:hypothetical protein